MFAVSKNIFPSTLTGTFLHAKKNLQVAWETAVKKKVPPPA